MTAVTVTIVAVFVAALMAAFVVALMALVAPDVVTALHASAPVETLVIPRPAAVERLVVLFPVELPHPRAMAVVTPVHVTDAEPIVADAMSRRGADDECQGSVVGAGGQWRGQPRHENAGTEQSSGCFVHGCLQLISGTLISGHAKVAAAG